MTRGPIFLDRRAYLHRRWADAARVLPFVGLFLFLVPMGGASSARTLIALFGVWFLLVAAAAVLARRLDPGQEE